MKTNALTDMTADLRHWLHRRLDRPIARFQSFSPTLPQQWQRPILHLYRVRGWMLGGMGLLLLWVWLWQWLLSITVGLTVMVGVYLGQQPQFQSRRLRLNWQTWRQVWHQVWNRAWNQANRALTRSGLAGLTALGATYLVTAVWQETDQHGLTLLVLLEGLGILVIVGLLRRQSTIHAMPKSEPKSELKPDLVDLNSEVFQALLSDLSHADPLKRLLAVRQTTYYACQTAAFPLSASQLLDCLRLMLDREIEPLICAALLESIQVLNSPCQLAAPSTAAQPAAAQPTGEGALPSGVVRIPIRTKVAQEFAWEEEM